MSKYSAPIQNKWTEETCYQEAKKYTTRTLFQKGNQSAYKIASINKWIDDYTWFIELKKPDGFWNYENCYQEAKKYTSRKEFSKVNQSAYQIASRNKWLNDYDWFIKTQIPNSFWIYDTCKEEAKKYTTRNKFRIGSTSAYQVACKNKWLDDYIWFVELRKPDGFWNYENCYKEAKKYKTTKEFRKENLKIYQTASNNRWLDDYTWLVKLAIPIEFWTYENCYKEAKKYTTRTTFQKGSCSAYQVACKNKWLDDYTWFIEFRKPNNFWTYKNCKKEAKKYKTRSEFIIGSIGAYQVAYKNKWLDNYTWFVELRKPDGFYTYENCFQEAKKYTTRTAFQKGCGRAYYVAWKNKWLDDYNWFIIPTKPISIWNYDTCKEEAMKYTTRTAFQKGCGRAYYVAWKNKWLKDYSWFIQLRKPKNFWTYDRCENESKKYKTKKEFMKGCPSAYCISQNNNWLKNYDCFMSSIKSDGLRDYENCYQEAKNINHENQLAFGIIRIVKRKQKNINQNREYGKRGK